MLHYAVTFVPGTDDDAIVNFLLVAGALGAIYQQTASISGAEVGCQGEVGTACSMAAGALAEILGGTPEQAENAAEIGMEHNLGLTCDPVGGLVQIPCIERNAVGSVQAITPPGSHSMAMGSTVSLDKVIKTMMQTGRHESQVQGDCTRRPSRQHRGVLTRLRPGRQLPRPTMIATISGSCEPEVLDRATHDRRLQRCHHDLAPDFEPYAVAASHTVLGDLDLRQARRCRRRSHCPSGRCCAGVPASTGSLSPSCEFPLRIVGHVPARGKEVWRGHCFVQGRDTRLPGADHPSVDKLNLEIGDGEFMVLVGPSGCGKSTSLRMLAGLEEINAGAIWIGERDVTDLPPKDRDIAMVFQNYALYPMTVGDNMGFALKMAGVPESERQQRVKRPPTCWAWRTSSTG